MADNEWIDLSLTLKSGMLHWPGDPPVLVERVHDMDKGDRLNLSRMVLGVHSGTHLDAPLHFITGAPGIDRVPLDLLIGEARVVEIGAAVSVKEKDLAPHGIERGERILLRTGNSTRHLLHKEAFDETFVYLEEEAARFLAARGIRVLGVDYLSVGGYQKNGADVHRVLLEAGVAVIEGLDLAEVSAARYDMICLPMKILESDGAPARVVLRKQPGKEQNANP